MFSEGKIIYTVHAHYSSDVLHEPRFFLDNLPEHFFDVVTVSNVATGNAGSLGIIGILTIIFPSC